MMIYNTRSSRRVLALLIRAAFVGALVCLVDALHFLDGLLKSINGEAYIAGSNHVLVVSPLLHALYLLLLLLLRPCVILGCLYAASAAEAA